jgi:hypothetical protein
MRRKWPAICLLLFATTAVCLSFPLYVVAIIGVGMSPSQPHLGLPTACLLWTPAFSCVVASIIALRIQRPVRIWHWIWTVPLLVVSVAEGVWTLLILLRG